MQQRQLRLGDILDDYCPRERRVTNHAVVAMIGEDVKHVRCTTCDADHEFKHAKVPRQRRKTDTPAALYAQVLATGPKRVAHEAPPSQAAVADALDAAPDEERMVTQAPEIAVAADEDPKDADAPEADASDEDDADGNRREDEGPAHRRLIRASLPKIDGAPPPTRQIPEFTIRQPAGRPANRFRPRGPRGPMGAGGSGGGGQQFQGNRSGGGMRSNGGRPPQGPGGGQNRRSGPGRRRPK